MSPQLILYFLALVGPSFQYKMDVVTRNPLFPSPTPINESRMALLQFELQRSPTLQTIESRLGLEDAEVLCNYVNRDADMQDGISGKKIFHFIPISAAEGFSMPSFVQPCYGWIRKRCSGTAQPPFDYRCHFWAPYYFLSDASCYYSDKAAGDRKKRMTSVFEPLVVNGLEAATLCATSDQLPDDKQFEFDSVALPTNEATQLRCINWKLSMDGQWGKEQLDKQACELMNHYRPSAHLQNEVYQGTVTDMFADVVKCEAIDKIVRCRFLKQNVREPSL